MAQTKAALVSAALEDVLKLGAGQTIATEDSTAVGARVAPLIDMLRADRIITISNVEAIPDYAFPDLVRLLAEEIAPSYGRPSDLEATKAAKSRLAELSRRDRSASALVLAVLEQLEIMGASSTAVDQTLVSARLPRLLATLDQRGVIYISDVAEVEDGDHPAFSDLASWVATQISPLKLGQSAPFFEARLRRLSAVVSDGLVQKGCYF